MGDAAIQRFDRFHRRIINTGMADHIAVRVVTYDGIVFAAVDGAEQFIGQFRRAHFRLQIVGRDFWRVD
ncbi:hypothetical protein D3C78_1741260 [compost metagenome]